ncbi:MAG: hypothetical protein P1V34_11195 [Alphaproteobacteria bacterium]|nr:hypothetical protein [Alphaproteobacteria bacterium]
MTLRGHALKDCLTVIFRQIDTLDAHVNHFDPKGCRFTRNDAGEILGWDYECDASELAEWDRLDRLDSIFDYDDEDYPEDDE